MTPAQKDRCRRLAQPQCPECDGDGWISVAAQQTHHGYVDVPCDCVRQRAESA